jgi:hypothetical protein
MSYTSNQMAKTPILIQSAGPVNAGPQYSSTRWYYVDRETILFVSEVHLRILSLCHLRPSAGAEALKRRNLSARLKSCPDTRLNPEPRG